MNPAQYKRNTKEWSTWIGRTGLVVAVTQVHVSAPELSAFTPYSYAIVEINGQKTSWMGVAGETLVVGDTVECVLRKIAQPDDRGIIPYGIKVRKI